METKQLTFKVHGLDCAEEVSLIRSALIPLGYSADELSFDLMRGKLSIHPKGATAESTLIRVAVDKAGLRTQSWAAHVESDSDDAGFWSRHGRLFFCVLSGVMNVLAITWHGSAHGWNDALGGHGDPHTYPIASLFANVVAVGIGFWFVLPKGLYAFRNRRAGMNLLMCVAVIGAMILGEWMEVVRELGVEGGEVAMLGDGVNDAPAMATASLGIGMAAMGSDAAIETADIALISDDLLKVPWLIQHARRTLGIVKQNIAFALGVKFAFVMLALFGISTLWMAIVADMGASLLVIANGLRLLRAR